MMTDRVMPAMPTNVWALPQGQFMRWGFYGGLVVVVAGILAFNIFRPITVLPRITLAPGYALSNQMGETITSEDRRGKLTLYSFSYTNCGTACAQTVDHLTKVHNQLAQVTDLDMELGLITLSVDPEHDTVEALQSHMPAVAAQNAVPWFWLTGDPQQMKYIIGGGFNLYYGAQTDGTVRFQPRYVLVDGMGVIRAYYQTAELQLDVLSRDIHYVVEEVRHSEGVAKLAYEAAHLFLCYPR